MNIIIPSGQGGMFKPRKNLRQLAAGGLNILKKTWQDVMIDGPKFHLRGLVGYDIIDVASGIILKHVAPEQNLILNCGKDLALTNKFANCFLYGHLSTDTATPALTDTSMAGWAKQTSTYGSGDGATTSSGDVISLTRSFVFTAETGDVTYTKFYSSVSSGSGATPFNEIVFGTPITLSSGQQAKVTMTLELTVNPHTTADTYSSDIISGISGSTGSFRVISAKSVSSRYFFAFIESSGSATGNCWATGGFLEPSYAASGNCIMDASSQSTLSSAVDLITETGTYSGVVVSYYNPTTTLSTYVSGSFERTKTILADLSNMNGTGLQSLFVGRGTTSSCWQLLLNTTFTKLNTQKLTLNVLSSIS